MLLYSFLMLHLIRAVEFGVRVAQYAIGIGSGSRTTMGEAAYLKNLPGGAVVFDVGANIGQFASLVEKHTRGAKLYCFEPAKAAYTALCRNVRNAQLLNIGLSDAPGNRTLHYETPGSGMASVLARRLEHFGMNQDLCETIEVDTVDTVCEQLAVNNIDLLKMDVEGHELAVLKGASGMLSRGCIKSVQFEFGGCNIDSRTFFQDFFYLFKQHGFTIHRITPFGYLYPIENYREADEQFRTTNYLALRQRLSG